MRDIDKYTWLSHICLGLDEICGEGITHVETYSDKIGILVRISRATKTPYFLVYNSEFQDDASKVTRIRIDKPEYLQYNNTTDKAEWRLNEEEIKELIDVLNIDEVWDHILKLWNYKSSCLYGTEDVQYARPDYSKLKYEDIDETEHERQWLLLPELDEHLDGLRLCRITEDGQFGIAIVKNNIATSYFILYRFPDMYENWLSYPAIAYRFEFGRARCFATNTSHYSASINSNLNIINKRVIDSIEEMIGNYSDRKDVLDLYNAMQGCCMNVYPIKPNYYDMEGSSFKMISAWEIGLDK